MVWWLGFGVFTAVAWVQSLVGELGSCKLCMQWKHGVLSFTLFMVSFEEKKDLKKCLFFFIVCVLCLQFKIPTTFGS